MVGLLARLQVEHDYGCLLISHDIAVIGALSHRVAVMYAGRVVETGPVAQVLREPCHPDTLVLLDAVARRTWRRAARPGLVGAARGHGVAYSTRCRQAGARCRDETPDLIDGVRCWHPIPQLEANRS